MKKTLLATALLIAISATTLTAEAFSWSSFNPANWGNSACCNRTASCDCKCKKQKCDPCKKEKLCPTEKASCPCKKEPKCNSCDKPAPCNPCDRLQQENER